MPTTRGLRAPLNSTLRDCADWSDHHGATSSRRATLGRRPVMVGPVGCALRSTRSRTVRCALAAALAAAALTLPRVGSAQPAGISADVKAKTQDCLQLLGEGELENGLDRCE